LLSKEKVFSEGGEIVVEKRGKVLVERWEIRLGGHVVVELCVILCQRRGMSLLKEGRSLLKRGVLIELGENRC
jgi:hypothetical protein